MAAVTNSIIFSVGCKDERAGTTAARDRTVPQTGLEMRQAARRPLSKVRLLSYNVCTTRVPSRHSASRPGVLVAPNAGPFFVLANQRFQQP
jgi:hypothetical protein